MKRQAGLDAEEFNVRLGRQLRRMREKRKISQPVLAGALGVHPNTVRNWEKGLGLPTILFLRACAALDEDAGRILAGIVRSGGNE